MKPEVRPSVPDTSRRVRVLDCPLDALDMRETVARCDSIIESGVVTQLVAINAAKVVAIRKDERLRRIVENCDVISADGQSVVWTARLLGSPVPERVPGIELMYELLGLAQQRGYAVYILGAKEGVLKAAVAEIQRRYPRIVICGYHHGYFTADETIAIVEEMAACKPDILMVAMSSPQKEYWLADHGRAVGAPIIMGVGGSIDVVAGVTRRAPKWMQRVGLEWLFRLIQEPRRLARRYTVTNLQFLGLLVAEIVRARPGRRREGR